jgi:hypothetical protein
MVVVVKEGAGCSGKPESAGGGRSSLPQTRQLDRKNRTGRV